MSTAKTWISILNWNGAADTLKTLASVRIFPNVHTIIVDNGSTDGSVARLESFFATQKIDFQVLSATDFAAGRATFLGEVTLVVSPKNKGFAGGNNVVLNIALSQPQVEAVWLLNNDALANAQTLPALWETLEKYPDCGFAGSVILDSSRKNQVQCYGVKYYPWLGISKLLGKGSRWTGQRPSNAPPSSFEHGASLLVRTAAMRQAGLLDERFFLYSEEQDWQERAAGKGWGHLLSAGSTVHHLGSMSTDASRHLFFYHYNRSAFIFSRLHNNFLQQFANFFTLPAILLLRTKGNRKSLGWGLKGLWHGLRFPL